MSTSSKTRMMRVRMWQVVLLPLLLAVSTKGYAQTDCFTYDEYDETIIIGLTTEGTTAITLTIPKTVTRVESGAFADASSSLTELIVDDGNPVFESGLFGSGNNTLTTINMGDGMSVANMIALLKSVGTFQEGTTIEASGFSGEKDTGSWSDVTWNNVTSVTLPAELIADQDFGSALVYGRFTIDKEIVSFCTSATFMDIDEGSNMLFYVADYRAEDGRLHIQRVKYIAAGKGVLIHRLGDSNGSCDLLRDGDINDNTTQATNDKELYGKNMLKGVTTATEIGSTDGTYTNYVLKDGAFHPTSGGTIKANRAYLQIPTTAARGMSLAIDFDDEAAGISSVSHEQRTTHNEVYDLQGRKVTLPTKDLYITNGKKYVIR